MKTKKCTKCSKIKEIDEFHKRKNSKDDHRNYCKKCISAIRKQYQITNKEKIAQRKKLYRETNKIKVAERLRIYYKINKEKISIQKKQYRVNNPEKIKEQNEKRKEKVKQWRINNRDRINKHNKKYRKENKEVILKKKINYRKKQANYLTHHEKLTVDESPRLAKDKVSLEVKCRYCGKYFIPTNLQTINRIQALNGQVLGENSLYCSDNCKESCPIYKQVKYPKGFKPASSREVNPLIRQMCFERDNWTCQICGASQKETPLHCHHIEGVAQNPRLGNDVKNTITLCKACHKEVHELPGCNYYELRCNK